QPRAFTREEGDTGRGITDQRRAPSDPAIQSDLAHLVEVDGADTRHSRQDLGALPTDIGKNIAQYRFTSLFVRGTLGRKVLVANKEEKECPVLAHGEPKNLSPWNTVADIDQFVARAIVVNLECGDVIAE